MIKFSKNIILIPENDVPCVTIYTVLSHHGFCLILKNVFIHYFTGLPSERHAAVPPGEIQRLFRFMQDGRVGGISFEQAIHVFYRSFYPFSYDPCPWVEGEYN